MFIEIALGLHWLALIHFAGNAFLRTYQLLVSPSVLNYLVHHQYFHYQQPKQRPVSRLQASLHILAVKEWNLDGMMFRYLWRPFKWLGKQFNFLKNHVLAGILLIAGAGMLILRYAYPDAMTATGGILPLALMGAALGCVLFAFSFRGGADKAWLRLLMAHVLIMAAVLFNTAHIEPVEIILYGSGIVPAFLLGYFCLRKIRAIDGNISLSQFHGYVYEQPGTGFLFLLSAIGMLGFPVTAAFVGIDVLFTYIAPSQYGLITLIALCFIFIELAAIRIYCRVFLGPHKKNNHPVAFRSS
jgi:NADH-quinone oxidoreductase subunit L